MTTRISALVAALAVLGGTLTACGSGPNQTNAAVIFGDRVISVDDVQHRLDEALRNEPAAKELARNRKLDLVSRGIVNQLIRHELLAEAAKRDGLTVSERDLADFTAASGASEDPVQRSVDAAFDAKEVARDRLLLVNLGRKYMAKLQVVFDGALVVTPTAQATAVDLAKKIAAQPNNAEAVLQSVATEGVNPAVNQDFSTVAAFQFFSERQVVLAQVFGVRPNTVVAFPFSGGGEGGGVNGWMVALVKQRNDNATLAPQESAAAAQVTPQWDFLVGLQLIGSLLPELNIRVSPRYGVWDELAVGVAPNEAEKTGLVLPAAIAKP